MRLIVVDPNTGTPDVHRYGCADSCLTGHVIAGHTTYVDDYDSRDEVAADWFADIIAENLAEPHEYVSEIHFLPCCAELP